jgi:glycosyltransferase involved in cell wall biosynthesis
VSSEKPRLLIAANEPSTFRNFLLPFARHYRALGWRVDAMGSGLTSSPECLEAFDRVFDVGWRRNPADPYNLLRAPAQVRRVALHGYDLVHAHDPIAAFVTRFALRSLHRQGRIKVVYTAHGFHFFKGNSRARNAVFLTLERVAGPWADHLVVINREDEEAAKKYRLVPPERLHYMPGIGVDTSFYNPDQVSTTELRRLREELSLAPEDRVFLMVAEFASRKRHRDALAAFAVLARDDTRLVFAGAGPEMAKMRALAVSLGVAERVRFLGLRRDVPALLRLSEALLVPSQQEGLARCVMEALGLGTPVIGTDIRGVREQLADGCGVIVKVGDVTAITRAMAWLLDHPTEAQVMAAKARAHLESYDLRRIIELHDALYSEVLGIPVAT